MLWWLECEVYVYFVDVCFGFKNWFYMCVVDVGCIGIVMMFVCVVDGGLKLGV